MKCKNCGHALCKMIGPAHIDKETGIASGEITTYHHLTERTGNSAIGKPNSCVVYAKGKPKDCGCTNPQPPEVK